MFCGGLWMFCGCYVEHCGGMWMFCGGMWMFCGCYVEHCGGMWMFCGGMWMFCGCFVDVMWNIVEECGCNVDPPHLHISQFDQVLSPPWSVIFKYAIVDVMWTFHTSTLTIKLTADPFYTIQCICYQYLGLVAGVSTVPELWH